MQTIRYLDREILFFLNHLGAEGPAREVVIRLLATGLMYLLVAIVLYLSWKRPAGRQVLFCALGSALLALLAGKIMNQIVTGDRPFALFPEDVRHIELIVRPDSFPSIHAVVAFGLTGGVLFGRHRLGGVTMLVVSPLIITARVAAGVHWPSDVVGGALIGLAMAAVFVTIQRRYWPRLGIGRGEEAARDREQQISAIHTRADRQERD